MKKLLMMVTLLMTGLFAGQAALAQMMDMQARGYMILKAAEEASRKDPSKWDWPVSASEEVKQSIIEAGYTKEELRNIFLVLVTQAGNRWPNGSVAPPPVRMDPNDSRPFGTQGTMNFMQNNPLMAPNVKMGGRGFRGLEDIYGSNGYLMNSLSDRKNTVTYLIAKKNRIYWVFEFEGKHTGKLFGFPPTGKTLKIRETATQTFNTAGQVTETDFIGDDLSLYLQAGGKIEFPKE